MDPAIKSGFAIGFAVIAAAGGFYAWREGAFRPHDKQASAPAISQPATPPSAAPTPDKKAEAAPAAPEAANPAEPGNAQALAEPKAPEKAAEDARKEAEAKEKGGFDIVRVEPSGEMVVAGRCPAGCTAELTANGKTQDQVKADASGNFAMTPNALPPGDYELGLKVKTPDGKEKTSDQTVTVSVPAPPSKDVVVVLNEPNEPSKVLQKTDKEASAPTAPAEEKQAAAATPVAPKPDAPITLGAVDAEKGRFFVQGSAPAGAKLKIYLNNAPIADAKANGEGHWSLRVEKGLAPGDYVMRVDRLAEVDGKVLSRVESKFAYEGEVAAVEPKAPEKPAASATPQPTTPEASADANSASKSEPSSPSAAAPASPSVKLSQSGQAPAAAATPDKPATDEANPVVSSLDTVKVKRGDSLWRISRANYGQGMRYTIIFSANDSQIRDPDLIYPGQVLVVPPEKKTGQAESAGR